MISFAENLQRLMADAGLRAWNVAEATGLSLRTVKGILNGSTPRPHARTLHALARGLGVPVDDLFRASHDVDRQTFDRATNPVVDQVVAEQPQLFRGWSAADYDELYSRFGAGGALTFEGTVETATRMNRRRQLLRRATLVLESAEADVLGGVIDLLYRKVVIVDHEDELIVESPV